MFKIVCVLVSLVIVAACSPATNPTLPILPDENEITVDVVSAPFNDWGSVSVTLELPESVEGILFISLLPSAGEIKQSEFDLVLEGGKSKTVTTEFRLNKLGRTQLLAEFVTSNGVHYNAESVIWMTDQGGTVYPEGTDFDITPSPVIPTEEVSPFDPSDGTLLLPDGTVAISTYWKYEDRQLVTQSVRSMLVEIIDNDVNSDDDVIASGYMNNGGYFYMSSTSNYDSDEDGGKLDLYLLAATINYDEDIRVTNFDDVPYGWVTPTEWDISDGGHTFTIPIPGNNPFNGAMWSFNDSHLAHALAEMYLDKDMGAMWLYWESGQTSMTPCGSSCFLPLWPVEGVFISDSTLDSRDTTLHEVSHNLMYNHRGNFWWFSADLTDFSSCVLSPHSFFQETTRLCAQTEGWAEWAGVWLDGDLEDVCYDFDVGVCSGSEGYQHINLEIHNVGDGLPQGPSVEGRVASSYSDFVDSTSDGLDEVDLTMDEVWFSSYMFDDVWGVYDHWAFDKEKALFVFYYNGINFGVVMDEEVFLPMVMWK